MMPAFSFQARFAPLVESFTKKSTIRRKRRAKPGDILYLYTGLRTKACRKLGEGICTSVAKVTIYEDSFIYASVLGNCILIEAAKKSIAEAEGFKDWDEMRDWFKEQYGLPFTGYMHFWRPKV